MMSLPLSLVLMLGTAPQNVDTSTKAVVARAAAYVTVYQQQLTSVLANEHYTQRIVEQVPADGPVPRTRTLESELFFMFTPGGDGWMAIRDVRALDGQRLDERPDLREALRQRSARDVARSFKAYNSRFNLGRTFRNFNEPTLALLVLDDRHRRRFRFERTRVERHADVVLVVLTFVEKDAPTLIRDARHGRMFARGELIVEAATGRIRRTTLTGKIGPMEIELTTAYASDGRLDMWVPVHFRERYKSGAASRDAKAEQEHVVCEAAYSNYRRFETSVRVR